MMNVAIKNLKELKEKYPAMNIDKKADQYLKYYFEKGFEEKIKKIWLKEINDFLILENTEYSDIEPSNDFTYKDDKGIERVSIPKVVERILFNYDFVTIYGKRNEDIYVYDRGVYKLKGREIIEKETERLLDYRCNSRIVSEVIKKIKRKTALDKEEFDNVPEHLICLENGIFNLKTKELMDFNPNIYLKSRIPIYYSENAKINKILDFFKEAIYPEYLDTIQEWFGFCLYKRYFIKKAVIIFGEKNTGKTIFLSILEHFIGKENIAGISLQKIASQNNFALSNLKDKFVNSYDDLNSDDLNASGGFKLATGGGSITGEYKFGDTIKFMSFAKNIFATNHIPSVKDINDDAYYERWIPIPFDNQVDNDKMDNFLLSKLLTRKEMSGLFNWALKGLDRLLKNGKFSYNKNSEQIKIIMQRQNNPLVAFSDEILIREDGNKISKEIMFKIYTKWCQEKGVPRLSKEQLGRRLGKINNYILAKGGNERVWENVNINSKYSIFT